MIGNNESEIAIKRLNAAGPAEDMKEKLMLFGQFVGDWDIVECKNLMQDGSWKTSKGELHWGWILGGRAVQDIWTSVPDMGTTVRFYDSGIDAWRSTWISPTQNVVRMFTGNKVGDEIVLETKESSTDIMKWIFFSIQENSFRWRAERSNDGGLTWKKTEEMFIIRQK
ncbi:MAG: hypothetical protein M0T81_02720 [Thermoplasmatales archaeon]|nr:hypothetical protein [Thermoplasmatales archaeon]